MTTVLIVEDAEDVNAILAELFTTAGYEVICAYDGLQAKRIFGEHEIDLVLLDIMLPYMSGDALLQQFRQTTEVPIIMISAKDLVSTKIDLLRLGADDYITKPFDLGEVLARAENVLRRTQKMAPQKKKYTYKEIELDDETKRVFVAGQEVTLTATELALLSLFIQHPDKVFTKANLYESVWHDDYLGDDHIIKTHMSNLRQKLQPLEYIETIRGLGYRLK